MARPDEPNLGELSTMTGEGLPGRVVASPTNVPATIDRYRVERVLGAGGMGVVFAAFDPELHRRVAIKLISAQASGGDSIGRATRRLLREAQAMARVSHPNVVTVYDVGVVDDQVFVAMELVDGLTLNAWLDERPRALAEILRVFVDAGRGLAAAHAAGLVHRDFKPDNVMVGSDGHVYVLDFGLARPAAGPADEVGEAPAAITSGVLALRATMTHGPAGTPLYMAPEQHTPEAGGDHRVDQFALCVALYRVLYKQHPFRDDSFEQLRRAVLEGDLREPPKGARVPAHLDAALRRGMSAERERRFPDMNALLAALAPPGRSWRRVALAVAASAVVLALFALFAVRLVVRAPVDRVAPSDALPLLQRQLTYRGDVDLPALSPDDRQVAFVAPDGVHVTEVATGRDRLVSAGHFRRWLDWMPDGASLVSMDDEQAVVQIALADGRVDHPLGKQRYGGAAVVEGGRAFALYFQNGRGFGVRAPGAAEAATRPCRVDVGQMWTQGVVASPGGERVAVIVQTQQNELSVYTVRSDCTDRHLIVDKLAPGGHFESAQWVTTDRGPAIYIMGLGAGGRSHVVRLPVSSDGAARGASELVLADLDAAGALAVGSHGEIVYLRGNGASNLWWMVRDGDVRRALTNDTARRSMVVRSPDGQLAAFDERAGPRRRLVVIHLPDGRERAAFELAGDSDTSGLAWSPDSDALALVEVREATPTLRVYPLDGGAVRTLVGVVPSVAPGSLAWSPDGRLLFQDPGNRNFTWLSAQGGELGALAREPYRGWMFVPVISPDGLSVALVMNRPPERGLFELSVATGAARLLLADDGYSSPMAWSADGAWIYYQNAQSTDANRHGALVRRVRRSDGYAEDWWDVSCDGAVGEIALGPDGRDALLDVYHGEEDLWLVAAR